MMRDARQGGSAAFVPLPFPEVLGLRHESHMSLRTRTEWSNARITGSGINEHPKDSFQQMGRIHHWFHGQLKLGTSWRMYPNWFCSTRDTCVCAHVCAHVCLWISMLKTTHLVSRWAPFHFPFEEQPSTRQKGRSIQCQKRLQLQEVQGTEVGHWLCIWVFRRLSEHLVRKCFFQAFPANFPIGNNHAVGPSSEPWGNKAAIASPQCDIPFKLVDPK